ncbi:MAG: hypothetical protein LBG74_06385, partial [Spirochaetaceae bacterium]|nr:hypothetical protein [Spirochaetaceae bacterium]
AELPNEPDDIEDLESAGELEPLEEDENAGLAFACAGAPLADTGIHARKTVFTENTAWAELEKQDRKRQIETAREELAGAIMKGIRTRRETEKAEAAYDTLPEILENDPMPEMAGDNGHSNTADTDSSPLAYGILEADSGAEEEIPELLEALEESEAAGQSELELARMDYGTWIPDSLPPPESPAETPPSSDSAPPPSGSLPTDKPAVETPPFAQNLPPLNELATVPFEEADIPDEYYDVEEFEEVTEEDMANAAFKPIDGPIYTFETPHKGTDINEIAKEIDTAPLPEQTDNSAFFDDKFDMDVTSPVDYMFAKDIVPAKEKVSAKLNQPDDTIITEKDGVNYIRTGMLKNAYGGVEVDLRFKSLVDDVLS